MWISVRKRYLRLLAPVMAGLLILAALLLWLSGFGLRFLFQKPQALGGMTAAELPGSYVTLPVEELGVTFSYLGYQDENGQSVVRERFCIYPLEGKYLIVRVSGEDVRKLEVHDDANDLVTSGAVGSLLEVDFGDLRGTVNGPAKQEVTDLLRSCIQSLYIDSQTLTDTKTGADLRAWPGAEEGDYSAYLDQAIYPLQLEANYWGRCRVETVKLLSGIAAALTLLALGLAVSCFLGLWEKPMRAAARKYGGGPLAAEYQRADAYGTALRMSDHYLWWFRTLKTRLLRAEDVVWAYPRSRRLDGGRLVWSLVLKTVDGEEAAVRLGEEALVQRCILALQAKGYPLVVGFDKEKQKLYQKDLTAFRARARNQSL